MAAPLEEGRSFCWNAIGVDEDLATVDCGRGEDPELAGGAHIYLKHDHSSLLADPPKSLLAKHPR